MREKITLTRRQMVRMSLCAAPILAARSGMALRSEDAHDLDIRDCGAVGDGKTLDTAAIQSAIDRVAQSGGGRVIFPSGTYLCFSLHLRSHVTLMFSTGVILLGATPGVHGKGYDPAEPQSPQITPFQDYGHNHWHNSLLWGEDIEDVALTGPGLLWGRGLQKGDGPAEEAAGAGNKILALKNCRNVLLRDLKMLDAGHFGILASGVDNLTIDNLLIDTRRDGIDIDSCRNVHIANCTVNSPWDDGIVIKSSYSLGSLRPCEQVTITGCTVSGCYVPGSVINATFLPFTTGFEHDQPAHVGRIKIGTETNGDIRNIVVSNCVFEGCRGYTITCEDGGHIEDVAISNTTMRNMFGPPVFVRLGDRLRGPAGTEVGAIRSVSFDGIDCWNASPTVCSIIAGLPGHPVEEINVRNLRIHHASDGALRTGEVPENSKGYPDVEIFGRTPAQGFYIRHAERLKLNDIEIASASPDPRPVLVLDDAHHVTMQDVTSVTPAAADAQPFAVGRSMSDVSLLTGDGHALSIGPYQP